MKNPNLNWARKVSRRKLKRLYESDAKGMLDTELLDEVGYGFYARLLDMFEIDEASRGRVKCRRCRAIILRTKGSKSSTGRIYRGREEVLKCSQCDWEITWGDYFDSYSGKSLQPNRAEPFFAEYLSRWPKLKEQKDKLLLIDWLIHQFHLQYKNEIPVKPAAVNLIEGTPRQIISLLDELAYGPESTADVEARESWRNQLNDEYRVILTTIGANNVLRIGKELGIKDYRKISMKNLIDEIRKTDETLLLSPDE